MAEYGRIREVPRQEDFYVGRAGKASNRAFVIISDALRYEVAASLYEQLRLKTQANVELTSVQV